MREGHSQPLVPGSRASSAGLSPESVGSARRMRRSSLTSTGISSPGPRADSAGPALGPAASSRRFAACGPDQQRADPSIASSSGTPTVRPARARWSKLAGYGSSRAAHSRAETQSAGRRRPAGCSGVGISGAAPRSPGGGWASAARRHLAVPLETVSLAGQNADKVSYQQGRTRRTSSVWRIEGHVLWRVGPQPRARWRGACSIDRNRRNG